MAWQLYELNGNIAIVTQDAHIQFNDDVALDIQLDIDIEVHDDLYTMREYAQQVVNDFEVLGAYVGDEQTKIELNLTDDEKWQIINLIGSEIGKHRAYGKSCAGAY